MPEHDPAKRIWAEQTGAERTGAPARIRLRVALVAVLAAALAAAATQLSLVKGFETFFDDFRISAHHGSKPSTSIVILAIDDQTLEGRPYISPIDRSLLAAVVQKLDKAKAAAIGLDILLDRPSEPAADAALAAALKASAAPVVLASDPGLARRRAICSGRDAGGAFEDGLLPQFRAAARVGQGVLCPDERDGVVRMMWAGGADSPSLAQALEAAAGGKSASQGAGLTRLSFSLTREGGWPFPTYSAADLDLLPDAWFAGKTVLVGAISPYGGDWQLTPLRFRAVKSPIEPASLMPEGKLPGVVIHAYALAGLRGEIDAPRAAGLLTQILFAALGAGLGALLVAMRWRFPVVAGALLAALVADWLAIYWLADAADILLPFTGFAAGLLLAAGGAFALLEREERAQRKMIHQSFAHFLAPEIVDMLARRPSRLRIEAEEREVTALFTDLEGFTSFVDSHPPAEVARALNGYLDCIIEAVVRHGGVVDKIVGDAVHALFSAPLHDPQHRENAMRCALDIRDDTEGYRRRMAETGVALGRTRTGVNSGPALVGNFGGSKRFDYTAHGSTINVAARLEAANKEFGGAICVSAAAKVEAPGLAYREIGWIPIRGVSGRLHASELVRADHPGLDGYAEAMACLETAPERAVALLAELAAQDPADGLVAYQLAQARRRLGRGAVG